jgi:hypothetical protein
MSCEDQYREAGTSGEVMPSDSEGLKRCSARFSKGKLAKGPRRCPASRSQLVIGGGRPLFLVEALPAAIP